ncbi:MAG: CNNM domain-containing protein, partial [Pseudomonadota bacterium]
MDILITLGFVVLLLGLSAFFSGSETALTAASRANLYRLAREGNTRAQSIEHLLDDRERLIGGILLGNNLVNILASAITTSLMITLVGDEGVFIATIVMTALVLIFAEVMPKTFAIARSDETAMAVGPIIGAVVFLLGPIVQMVQRIVRATLKLLGVDIDSTTSFLSSHDEIRGTIDLHASEGTIIKEHRDMLGSILDLDDVYVEDVMVHRKAMKMVDIASPSAEIVAFVVDSIYTRIPVFEEDPDNIIGVLHAKDVLRAVQKAGASPDTI